MIRVYFDHAAFIYLHYPANRSVHLNSDPGGGARNGLTPATVCHRYAVKNACVVVLTSLPNYTTTTSL